jgi:hypothetical protein
MKNGRLRKNDVEKFALEKMIVLTKRPLTNMTVFEKKNDSKKIR